MARPTDERVFLNRLRSSGGRMGNRALQESLGWADEKYWRVHQEQFEAGHIKKGRGYGGTVILVERPIRQRLQTLLPRSRKPQVLPMHPPQRKPPIRPLKMRLAARKYGS
jgi:hypothetical protein